MNTSARLVTWLATCLLVGHSTLAHAAGDASTGKQKAAVCSGCHGPDGNSSNPAWPTLAGQGQKYLAKQLNDFKRAKKNADGRCTEGRCEPTMEVMVQSLSGRDIEDIAAFYATRSPRIGQADPALVTTGQTLYRGGDTLRGVPSCMGCHGPAGWGNAPAGYPRLGGQHSAYTEKQLRMFKSEDRTNDEHRIMRDTASKLTLDEIKAIASYIQGLHE